jgi:hypothetical protein
MGRADGGVCGLASGANGAGGAASELAAEEGLVPECAAGIAEESRCGFRSVALDATDSDVADVDPVPTRLEGVVM